MTQEELEGLLRVNRYRSQLGLEKEIDWVALDAEGEIALVKYKEITE
jgi:hypothetical protein